MFHCPSHDCLSHHRTLRSRRSPWQCLAPIFAFCGIAACALLGAVAWAVEPPSSEGSLKPFLGEPIFDSQAIFKTQRYPNVVVTLDGTLLAVRGQGDVRARRSADSGKTWGPEIVIAKSGWHGGGMTVVEGRLTKEGDDKTSGDETGGDVLVFVEEKHPPAKLTVYRSRDSGRTWKPQKTVIHKDLNGNVPSMHMNENGLTLRHGPHAGRLIRPARDYAAGNEKPEWPNHYTTAIYSDDGGNSWQTSDPFPEKGTGEAAIVELSDGRLYYNSRVHLPTAKRPTRRRCAYSYDGGKTWKGWRIIDALPDGRQDRAYGCMGGLTRLRVKGRDVLIFSNLDTPRDKRERATVWASFDGGETWPVKRLVDEGPSAYSALAAGRPGTASEGSIYLHYEVANGGGLRMARFNLSWLLGGTKTRDGELPSWANRPLDQ